MAEDGCVGTSVEADGDDVAAGDDLAGGFEAATTVNMESVIKAAQWDPYKSSQSITPGAGDDVKAGEQALADKNLLVKKYVDGHFGTSAVTAYQKYQKSLGYTGLDASGLPGKSSLTELGKGEFTVEQDNFRWREDRHGRRDRQRAHCRHDQGCGE